MVDVVAIPDGFKHGIAKPEYEYVLDRVFSQVVIDTVNLIFSENCCNLLIQFFCRFKVSTKWFLNNNPTPALLAAREFCFSQAVDYCGRKRRWNGKVEHPIVCVGLPGTLFEPGTELRVS